MTLDSPRQLRVTVLVRSRRQTDKDLLTDLKDVSAVQGSRFFNELQIAVSLQSRGDRCHFLASRCGARAGNHCEFVQHDRRILNEHRIRQTIIRGQDLGGDSRLLQDVAVRGMLPGRFRNVDGFSGLKGQLAIC